MAINRRMNGGHQGRGQFHLAAIAPGRAAGDRHTRAGRIGEGAVRFDGDLTTAADGSAVPLGGDE